MDALKRVGGKALEQNLLDELRKRGVDISYDMLRQTLMKLEIHGRVRVLSLDAERRVVELISS
ncbi:MAG: hypothetical protein NXY59_04830 [Aigarchaeota archaeon]|nr:hypothetical protein [Candidatus Pelearchaeum maunauluense]